MVHAALLLLMLEAVTTDLVFTISLKRSTQILQLSTSWLADYPIYWRHSGHCSALAHIANSGIFPAQSLKQGTKCRNSTTRRVCVTTALMFKATTAHTTNAACASGGGRQTRRL